MKEDETTAAEYAVEELWGALVTAARCVSLIPLGKSEGRYVAHGLMATNQQDFLVPLHNLIGKMEVLFPEVLDRMRRRGEEEEEDVPF